MCLKNGGNFVKQLNDLQVQHDCLLVRPPVSRAVIINVNTVHISQVNALTSKRNQEFGFVIIYILMF